MNNRIQVETKTYITYLFPGTFFPEIESKQVEETEVPNEIPADCYGFYFTQTEYVIDTQTKKKFTGDSKKVGKTYLIGESIYIDDIPPMDRGQDTDILKSNIRNNSPFKRGVKCHTGNWQIDDETVIVLSPKQFKIVKPHIYENWGKSNG
jgi:hypothetical protein